MFCRCRRWDVDPRFPKYPRLPVMECSGFSGKVPRSMDQELLVVEISAGASHSGFISEWNVAVN